MRYKKLDELRELGKEELLNRMKELKRTADRRKHPSRQIRHQIDLCRLALNRIVHIEQVAVARPRASIDRGVNSKHGKRIGACLWKGKEIFIFKIHHPDPTQDQQVKIIGLGGRWKHSNICGKICKSREEAISVCEQYLQFYKLDDQRLMDMADITFDKTREIE